ncbi:MAG: hypothetical protein OES79_12670 [Planctomycetota bacterium]|nr:hypothetical protein [Planctomycetota bacterium]
MVWRDEFRRGVATLDYILVLGVVFPMAAVLIWIAPRMMRLFYDFTTVVVTWPFS